MKEIILNIDHRMFLFDEFNFVLFVSKIEIDS